MENFSEEEQMAVNCSFERYRKAMIRAARNNQHVIEQAEKTLFILERTHNDNMIDRWISTPIAVSENKSNLIEFCHKLYGPEVEFDDKDHSNSIETDMGVASFSIKLIAIV